MGLPQRANVISVRLVDEILDGPGRPDSERIRKVCALVPLRGKRRVATEEERAVVEEARAFVKEKPLNDPQ